MTFFRCSLNIWGIWYFIPDDLGILLACRRLSLADRATMVPLLAAVVDFDATPETYARYDSMTALELFQKWVTLTHVQGALTCMVQKAWRSLDSFLCILMLPLQDTCQIIVSAQAISYCRNSTWAC